MKKYDIGQILYITSFMQIKAVQVLEINTKQTIAGFTLRHMCKQLPEFDKLFCLEDVIEKFNKTQEAKDQLGFISVESDLNDAIEKQILHFKSNTDKKKNEIKLLVESFLTKQTSSESQHISVHEDNQTNDKFTTEHTVMPNGQVAKIRIINADVLK